MLEIYKPNQGRYTRVLTFVCVTAAAVIGAYVLSEKLAAYAANMYVRFGVPTGVVGLLALVTFWFVNRPKSADFLIATEGEMKKVSWSSRKEIVGSTKVVIVTTMILAAVLFAVDAFLTVLFDWLDIMG